LDRNPILRNGATVTERCICHVGRCRATMPADELRLHWNQLTKVSDVCDVAVSVALLVAGAFPASQSSSLVVAQRGWSLN